VVEAGCLLPNFYIGTELIVRDFYILVLSLPPLNLPPFLLPQLKKIYIFNMRQNKVEIELAHIR
jgi:hypothetical protein